ncbi:hypothetical protein L1049_002868 [Liquidambar formosana]|uniref:TCP domain-containing protein n=1 Tax=Liquidambar formosana TaxID=63359 RepID=A0AAP0NIW8_LIQFO
MVKIEGSTDCACLECFGSTKDRHTKVRTVRGLRDRRVTLSMPVAIQLYDLQQRLGLKQPSKVVDWLLNAAQRDIDELPPLQMPTGNFGQNYHSVLASHEGRVEEKLEGIGGHGAQVPSNNFVSRLNLSSLPAGLFSNTTPYWAASNFALSHSGSHGFTSQTDKLRAVPLPSSLSLPSYLPSHAFTALVEFDPRQINHFQVSQNLSSNSEQE